MRMIDIIAKKRDGQALTDEEIRWFVEAFTRDEVPDYQAAALLMAICIRGMTAEEATTLTLAMAHSGDILDLSSISDYVVDKHSSGGVGDKTSLVVLPLVGSCGVPVAKMSGRGLGYSGGTLDKMEAIAGFSSNLTEDQFIKQAKEIGLTLSGQSRELAPADGKLYALRDVSGSVPSLPLIASSIMSKKIASGANGIVLDVKMGSGAFMKSLDDARALATLMVDIGRNVGRDVIAVISDMNQPLGYAVGNAIEVQEAIETLKGNGPEDLLLHCLEIAALMLRLAGRGERWANLNDTKASLKSKIENGEALDKFRQLAAAQGGDVRMVDDPGLMPAAAFVKVIEAQQSGSIAQVDAEKIAIASFNLGAGRTRKSDPIDLAVGVKVHVKVGDRVKKGDPVATIYANDEPRFTSSREMVNQGVRYSSDPVEPLPLFYDIIGLDELAG